MVIKPSIVNFLFFFYDLFFMLGFLFYLPFYFLRAKINLDSLKERLGGSLPFYQKSIWIHAVSVGEVNLIEPVLRRLKGVLDYPLVISTTTITGNQVARQKYAKIAHITYFPLDLSFILKKFLRLIRPQIFIAAETELWPNLIRCLKEKNIPFLIINGRVSQQAYNRYKLIRPLMKKILPACRHIGAQSQKDRERFLSLGALPDQVSVSGNLKFNISGPDSEKITSLKEKYIPLLKPGSRLLFVAASTHHPEEKIILDIYHQISKNKELTLLIAPRHPHRAPSLKKMAAARGFNSALVSEAVFSRESQKDVFILDTVGDLFYFYSFSDFCFVGGSFSGSGGHNILEPMYFLKPVIFGPSMENFFDIAETALNHSAAIQVDTPAKLKQAIESLLESPQKRLVFSRACVDVFRKAGGLEQSIKIILEAINV